MNTRLVRSRLSVMMFIEYFIFGAWAISLGTYMAKVLQFTGAQSGWVYSSIALGAIFSPVLVGYIADRLVATERLLAVLHVAGGAALLLAASTPPGDFPRLMTLMLLYALCYMPTLALTNSLAFRHIKDSSKEFPLIRVWGTIGWIAAGLAVGLALGETAAGFFYLAGGSALVMAVYCLTLPHTPPARSAKGDMFGLRAYRLLAEPSFAVFTVAAFLVGALASFYLGAGNLYLTETDRPAPTALQTLGQVSEIFFMAAMPWFIARFGLRNVLLIGLAAWAARFLGFASLAFPLVLVGILLHGVCYDFFYVAAFIYVDKRSPKDLRASAQSFIASVIMGVGHLVGFLGKGYLLEQYRPPVTIAAIAAEGELVAASPLPDWPETRPGESFWRWLDLKRTTQEALARLRGGEQTRRQAVSLARRLGSDRDDSIAVATLAALPDVVEIDGNRYRGADLAAAFRAADADGDGTVTRDEWLSAKAHRWRAFWLWPFGVALATWVLFSIGFRPRDSAAADNTHDSP